MKTTQNAQIRKGLSTFLKKEKKTLNISENQHNVHYIIIWNTIELNKNKLKSKDSSSNIIMYTCTIIVQGMASTILWHREGKGNVTHWSDPLQN